MMPVASVESRYILPAKYDEELTISTMVTVKPARLITFYSEIYNESKTLIHKAWVNLVFVNMDTQKSISCPDFLMKRLLPYFESEKQ